VDIIRSGWTEDLDPRVSPQQKNYGDYTMGRALIDACKPFHWRDAFPGTNIFSPEEKKTVRDRYAAVVDQMRKLDNPRG
jgi:4-hydroxy-3-polyprenylbenzoate decarboxylase